LKKKRNELNEKVKDVLAGLRDSTGRVKKLRVKIKDNSIQIKIYTFY